MLQGPMETPRQVNDSSDAQPERPAAPKRPCPFLVPALLVAVALAAYGNSLTNRYSLHETPNPFVDSTVDSMMLRNYRLLPKVFTTEFLLTTYGEYRPAGYAAFALVNGLMPRDVVVPWHMVLVAMHVLTAWLLFLVLRDLARPAAAFGLAALYLAHPAMAPFVNDVNLVYVLWGLLFSALSLWLYAALLRTGRSAYLVLSALAFVAALFAYRPMLVLPGMLCALCAFHERYPRLAAITIVYMLLGAYLAGLAGVRPLIVMGAGMGVFAFTAQGIMWATGATFQQESRRLARTVWPHALGLIGFVIVTWLIRPAPNLTRPLNALSDARWSEVFSPAFVSRQVLKGSWLNVAALAAGALFPLFFLRRPWSRVAVAAALVLAVVATAGWNPRYRDDLAYWRAMSEFRGNHPVVKTKLASALIEAEQYEEAEDLLVDTERMPHNPFLQYLVQIARGTLYDRLGETKLAGYYLLHCVQPVDWETNMMKHPGAVAAEFALRNGYLSRAEMFWACGLVLDPYDVRLYNSLGRVLIYKNFYRAAREHFLRSLELDRHNETALYHLAFIAKTLHDDSEYERYAARWLAGRPRGTELDFQPIFDAFAFDRDTMLEWFSGDPTGMSEGGKWVHGNRYAVDYEGRRYTFAEVPLRLGAYWAGRGELKDAASYYVVAHGTGASRQAAVAALTDVVARMKSAGDTRAAHYENVLEEMRNGTARP